MTDASTITPEVNDNKKISSFKKDKFFLVLQNQQYKEIEQKNFFEHYLDLRRKKGFKKIADKFFQVIFYMLQEKRNVDILTQDEFLSIEKITSHEISKYKQGRYYIDDLLANIIVYVDVPKASQQNGNTDNEKLLQQTKAYLKFKNSMLHRSQIFRMMFYIIEGNEASFCMKFASFLEDLSDYFAVEYTPVIIRYIEYHENLTSNFLFHFLNAAIRNDRKKIIDCILQNETFLNVDVKYPENIETGPTHNYAALKMLQNGFSIGRNEIPSQWITPQVMKQFLDSQIVHKGHDLIQLDCNFMLHSFTRKYQVMNETDVDEKLIFWDDSDSLNFVTNIANSSDLIMHPVLSTYIDLKTLKYQKIYWYNFAIFLVAFALPFSMLPILHCLFYVSNTVLFSVFYVWSAFGILIILAREILQFIYIDKKLRNYWRKKTNRLEVFLIVLAMVLWVLFWFKGNPQAEPFLHVISAFFVLILCIEILCLIPVSSSQTYTIIVNLVATTFFKYLAFFIAMLVPFSLCFCILFHEKQDAKFEAFKSFWSTMSELALSITGDKPIEDVELNGLEVVFIICFVFMTFWLSNLIIGFSVTDVTEIKNKARLTVLQKNSKVVIEWGALFYETIYKKLIEKYKSLFLRPFHELILCLFTAKEI